MKAAIFTFVALAITLGNASVIGSLQPKTTRNTRALINNLSSDPSGEGFNRLNADGTIQSVNAQGQILDQVQLATDDAAKIRASVDALKDSTTISNPRIFERSCSYKTCINNKDCPSGCHGGCTIVCYDVPVTEVNQCVIGVCLETS